MTKQELRKHYLQERKQLSPAVFKELNENIFNHFFAGIDLSKIRVIHTFLPIEKKQEPDTWPFVERLRKEFPHIKISIPRVNNQTGELENFYFEDKNQLTENIWGILEPRHGIPTEPNDIDLVLVPLLVFDLNGHRVGYGKGFYDKFFTACKKECKRIGISLFSPVDNIEGVNDFDIKLDAVVTPEKIFRF